MGNNRFDSLIDAWDLKLQRAFLEAVQNLRDAAQLSQIIAMLEGGDVDGALRAVGLNPVAFRPFDVTLSNAFEAGGIVTSKLVPALADADGLKTIFQFNIRNPAAESWLRDHSAALVQGILDDQRAMIRSYLTVGLANGANPRTSALDLVGRVGASGKREGGFIGLTDSQSGWVTAYAEELASENPRAALSRALRDKRFDRAVIKAAETGQPIPDDLIAKMVTTYKNRALRFRAEGIARTEAMTALHEAQEQSMEQAVSSGAVAASTVSFVWNTAEDARVRETHKPMDGQVRKLGEEFITGGGAHLRFPGDPFAPAAERINCRCWREPRVDFLAGIR